MSNSDKKPYLLENQYDINDIDQIERTLRLHPREQREEIKQKILQFCLNNVDYLQNITLMYSNWKD